MGVLTSGWHRRHTRHRRRRPLPPSPTTPSRRSTAPSPSPPDRTLRPSSSQEPGGNIALNRMTDQFCYLLLHPTNILLIYPQHIPQMLPKQFISGQGEQTGRPAELPKPHLLLSSILTQISSYHLHLHLSPILTQISRLIPPFRICWSVLDLSNLSPVAAAVNKLLPYLWSFQRLLVVGLFGCNTVFWLVCDVNNLKWIFGHTQVVYSEPK